MHRVEITRRAQRQIERLPPVVVRRVAECFDALAVTPRPAESKELQDDSGIWSLRHGRYRILYQLQADRLIVLGVVVSNRQRVTELLQEMAAGRQS